MINRVVLVGRLTKDVELRYTPSGVAMARFTLACNRPFKSEGGEQQADFINIIVWRKQAENTANFLKKGSLAGVEGRIQTGSYEGQDGKRVYTTDVVADSVQFLETKNGQANQNNGTTEQPNDHQRSRSEYQHPQTQPNYTRVEEDPFANSSGPIEVTDDDLPF
ncbi:single-stranded DNA-binding protein [Psychrobacillus lasiicapitis]|uniref:Single-stranded DNA-binding protein n=1 Tax=Psychrobacillus lasiicapitis TaxID=1636719 RepID=A0A544TAR6_9BACI|nr:single-stranded DNA-binding protein [Psychrobacillus lasiicapitis]TQR14448.1 single-stranded DNA-binding protein [Psychrobacillus lasiicapitis]GGA31263.1 single-stranded DNA-binding protein [Psychrobacillus lasiicapitis]